MTLCYPPHGQPRQTSFCRSPCMPIRNLHNTAPPKRRSLGVFDILKRDYSNLIDRDCSGKLHTTSFHRIKEIVERMSEEEKEALKASEADPEMRCRICIRACQQIFEIYSEVPVEGLFILKRGKTFYYHGTTAAKRLLQLQYEEYHKGRSNNIFMQLDSYFTLKDSVSILAPTATNGPQPTKRAKLSAVKEKAMREAFKKLLAQATNAEHPDPLRFRSLKTLESELAGRGFRLQFEGDWTWTTFESAYKSKSTVSFQAIVEAISGHRITVTPIDRRNEE